ncbi:PaaX family transcriptional regulator C-terminal domain-containing protein [Limnobacter sp.]|uniref:PaaX family transcriptional regulator C-terminal domain-containing protein n=1 Tax=Limnobacter sp. TaxID=2003368 RepID=UPI00351808D3
MRKPTAKSLILDLLLAANGRPLSAKQAIAACAIFDISVNNTRVALVRLSAEGLIESAGRALYQLTDDAHTLADDVAAWRTRSTRVRPWDGSYIVVQAEKLSRSEARQQRARARALLMLGFQPLNEHLFIRANNIEDHLDAVRGRLYKLGLEREAPVFAASHFDQDATLRIASLWNPRELETNYVTLEKKMRTWLDRHQALEPEVAARESFLLGGAAIKHVVYDPFLPEEWVDADARNRFLAVVDEVDKAGQRIWSALWASMEG